MGRFSGARHLKSSLHAKQVWAPLCNKLYLKKKPLLAHLLQLSLGPLPEACIFEDSAQCSQFWI